MIKIEIDGKQIEAEAGKMIIQVADQHDIPIPRFCYHKKLSVAANCRMCLIQVEKAPKPLPACATPIADGMKIWTTSAIAIEAQRSVMEFLLINHPLDCPICDQGGECELQDVSMQYGNDYSRYEEPKRTVLDENLGPLIATDMTRCIQCTRCVRFGTEISGERELGATGRGEFMKIETFVAQHVNSEVSGNIIDLCPVGALTSKPFRFKARAWELDEHNFIAPHDCIGSHINLHVRRDSVMRVVPRDCEDLNEIWLSDRDRFSYEALQHEDRLRKPMQNKNSHWQMISWIEALNYAAAGIKLAVETYGADQFGVLTSPSASLEELYLLQQLTRSLGSANIDHRLRELDFSDQELAPQFPNIGVSIKDLATQDVVLLVGCNIHKEQPIVGLKLRKTTLNGGLVCAINPAQFEYNFPIAVQEMVAGANLVLALAGVAKEILRMSKNANYNEEQKLLQDVNPTTAEQQIAAKLLAGKQIVIILGQLADMHPQASEIRAWANLISIVVNANCGSFSNGANASGAWLAGCVPHRLPGGNTVNVAGKNAIEMLQKPLKCYILFGIEPEFDSLLGEQALETLRNADFVVAITSFQSDKLLEIADVVLPMAAYAENSGTYINIEGKWQSARAAVTAFGDSRPGWKILRVLGNLMNLPDFEYTEVQQIRDILFEKIAAANMNAELSLLSAWRYKCPTTLTIASTTELIRIAPLSLYACDPLTRRAAALQATVDAISTPTIQMHPNTAESLRITDGEHVTVKSDTGSTKIQLQYNSKIPEFSVMIYQSNTLTNELGAPYSIVEVYK